MRFKLIVGVLMAVALIVAGCGGGDSSSSGSSTGSGGTDGTTATNDGTTATNTSGKDGSSGKPLTKKEFLSEGEAICQEIPNAYNAKAGELEKEKGKKPSTAETNLKAAVPPLHTAIEEFEALTPPKGEEKQVEEIIDALEAAAKGVEEKPTSELSGPKSPFNEFQEVTKKYGLGFCSSL